MSPERWRFVTEDDIRPKHYSFKNKDIYFRGSKEPSIPGQVLGRAPVFWQVDAPRFVEIDSSHLIFWQELGEGGGVICWKYGDDLEIKYWEVNKEGGDNLLPSPDVMGDWDALNIWCPKFHKKPYLEILISTNFVSLKNATKHCLITMMAYANDAGKVFALSNNQMVAMTGYSKETINTHLNRLENGGFIKELNKKRARKKVRGVYKDNIPKDYLINFGYTMKELDGMKLDQKVRSLEGRRRR